MALIDDIIKTIDALEIKDGKLVVPKDKFPDVTFMESFFDNVIKESALTLLNATRSKGDQTITIGGTASILGYKDLTLSVTFDVQKEEVVGTVNASFANGKTVTLPVVSWITIGGIGFTATINESFESVSFAFHANLLTNKNNEIPIILGTTGGEEWNLRISGDDSYHAGAGELIHLLGGNAVDQFIPKKLSDALDVVKLNGLESTFNITTKSIGYFSVGVELAKGWDIAPKISLEEGLLISFTVVNADQEETREFIANVRGTFMLGETKVPIQIGTSVGGTTVWSFGIQMGEKVTLPSLASLLSLGNAETSLPDGLANVPAISITTLRVDFNSTESKLERIQFAVETADTWPVIKNYFEVRQLMIDFDVTNVTDSKNRLVLGTLYGLFKIGDVFLFCSLAKTRENPDWTITAGLPPDQTLNFTDVVQHMFENKVTPPKDMPQIIFSKLLLTVVPGTGTLKFEAGSTSAWVLIQDKLSIESFDLEFTRTPTEIKGHVETDLRIVDVNVKLSASLNNVPDGGWEFTGSTKKGDKIEFGKFVGYLVSKFGVKNIPDWLSGLTLKDITVKLNTKTKDFSFDVTAETRISDKDCSLKINFALEHKEGDYTLKISGDLTIDSTKFTLDFTKTSKTALLLATWSVGQGAPLNLKDIARIFGNKSVTDLLSQIPPDMDLALTSLSFTYSFTPAKLILAAKSKNYGSAVFIGDKVAESWIFAFMLSIRKIDLTKLPLIGEEVGKLGPFEIDDLRLLLCSGILSKTEIAELNKLIAEAAKRVEDTLPELPVTEAGLKAGVDLNMTFKVAGYTAPIDVGTAKAGGSKALSLAEAKRAVTLVENAGGGDNVKTQNGYWINLQKAFGPVYMDKVGVNYKDGSLFLMFNFSLNMGALVITLDGLSGGSSLSKFEPKFGLDGLSLTFNSGAVQLSGGFIRSDKGEYVEYNGQALIKAGTFMISAMGSYADINGAKSLFIFALLSAPLGGPPVFFITGLAAGFGYNRGLKLPTIDEVADYPLVSGFVPGKTSPFSGSDPGKALSVLVSKNIVPVQIGQNWLAAGIQFTSFEMLQSFALVAVEFGTTLEIALIGMSTASIPTGAPNPLVFAQLALLVRILPDEGLVGVEAKLTSNSYLFSTNCHLTGGFAFYTWFGKNQFAGDFVVTIGGYHPNFDPPKHYPTVPRLGFNWQITSELSVKGGMYFALTPRCLMAGGSLEAVWKSGDLKAWFMVGANFLIAWKPFHYEIQVYISFGVSYTFDINLLFARVRTTISVSLGADLSIWGPEFSGVANIHLWIISFSISFGSAASKAPKPIDWQDFERSFLPAGNSEQNRSRRVHGTRRGLHPALKNNATGTAPKQLGAIATAKISNGLLKDLKPGADNPENLDWIVSPQGTVFVTSTLIPAKAHSIVIKGGDVTANLVITNETALEGINKKFGVGPVGVDDDDFESTHDIIITFEDGSFKTDQVFYVTAVIGKAPKAMWQNSKADLSNETLLDNVLLGFEITTRVTDPDKTPPVNAKLLDTSTQTYEPDLKWSAAVPVAGPAQPENPITELQTTIKRRTQRDQILDALRSDGFSIFTNEEIDLAHMEKEAGNFLLAPPQFAYEYWKAPVKSKVKPKTRHKARR